MLGAAGCVNAHVTTAPPSSVRPRPERNAPGVRRRPRTSRRTSTPNGRPGRRRADLPCRTGRVRASRAVRRLPVRADPAIVEVLAEWARSDSACRLAEGVGHPPEQAEAAVRARPGAHLRPEPEPRGEDAERGADERRDDERPDPGEVGEGEAGPDGEAAERADEHTADRGVAPPPSQCEGAVDGHREHEVDPRHRRHDRPAEAAGEDDGTEQCCDGRDEQRDRHRGAQAVTEEVASDVRKTAWTIGSP